MASTLLFSLYFLSFILLGLAQEIAKMPLQFQGQINETVWTKNEIKYQIGRVYYSFTETLKAQRVDRMNSQLNSLCQRVIDSPVPCTQLSFDNSDRWYIFPSIHYCCYGGCEGCGMLTPEWVSGGQFNGTQNINGVKCDYFNVPGFSCVDTYAQVASNGNVCLLGDCGGGPLMPYLWTFNQSDYQTSTSPKNFDIPSYCSRQKTCSGFRKYE